MTKVNEKVLLSDIAKITNMSSTTKELVQLLLQHEEGNQSGSKTVPEHR